MFNGTYNTDRSHRAYSVKIMIELQLINNTITSKHKKNYKTLLNLVRYSVMF